MRSLTRTLAVAIGMSVFASAPALAASQEKIEWKETKKNDLGDRVEVGKNEAGQKIYRVTAVIEVSADKLDAALGNAEDVTKWNTTITKSQESLEL